MTALLTRPALAAATGPATARCRCGGYLAPAAGGRLAHVDRCADCHTAPAGTLCDFADLHHACTTPTPVECRHYRCAQDAAPAGADQCATGHDACCLCCLED